MKKHPDDDSTTPYPDINGMMQRSVQKRENTELREKIRALEEKNAQLQQETKEALRKQNSRFKNLLQNLDGVVYRCRNDRNWSMEFISDGCLKLTGYTPEDFLANNAFSFKDIVLPRYHDFLWHEWQKKLKNGKPVEMEYEIRTASGDIRWVWERGLGVFDENGQVLHLEGFITDITKRKWAEETLQKSEKKYRSLFENARIGLFRTRVSDGRLLEGNQQLALIFGYRSLCELPHPVSIADYYVDPEERSRIIAELKEKGEIKEYETSFRKKDGSVIWLRLSCTLHKKEGHIEGVTADITEQKKTKAEKAQLEEQFRQAQKMEAIGRLAAGVAHDMNNLLTPILGFGGLLMDDFSPDDSRRRYMEEIVNAGYRSRDLVRQLLAFGRKQTLEYKPLNLNRTIKGFEKLLRRTIREDIALRFNLDPDIPTINADIGQIEQVIMNLSVNAQDAMPDGGTLTLETALVDRAGDRAASAADTPVGPYVLLAVSDNGCGMDKEILGQIFDPFYSTKGKQGTGLGLATVHGIIKQHGGSIRVRSKPGKGTSFRLCLPIHETMQPRDAQSEKKNCDGSAGALHGSETILLAEDNRQVRELGRIALTQQGYTVLVAENGADALALLERHDGSVNLLLSDVIMPGMNGKELFAKAAEQHPDLRVLYMSGYTDNVISHHGVLNEGVQFIQKPFTISGLAAKVREVLA